MIFPTQGSCRICGGSLFSTILELQLKRRRTQPHIMGMERKNGAAEAPQGRKMDDIFDMLMALRPGCDFSNVTRATRLMEDLRLTAEDGLALVAMLEALNGRIYGWEQPLATLGDLEDYLRSQGMGANAPSP